MKYDLIAGKKVSDIEARPARAPVVQLLAEARLPIDDIGDDLEHFFAARTGTCLDGVVGIEIYDGLALVRSLAVTPSKRGSGIGSELLACAERFSSEKGVRSLFLLTTTAKRYFEQRGYVELPRDAAPASIKATTEFSKLCPASAVLMTKVIRV